MEELANTTIGRQKKRMQKREEKNIRNRYKLGNE